MSDSVRTIIAATAEERADVVRVRVAVFVDEQGIPREEEIDEHDDTAIFCAGYESSTPVAAGRLVVFDDYGKIGRMAVLGSHRKRGLGAAVLAALESEGAARGVRTFRLSAQLHASAFYEHAGYIRIGDVYDEVGIPHIGMEKTLPP